MNIFQKQLLLNNVLPLLAEIHNELSKTPHPGEDEALEQYSYLVGPVKLPLPEQKVSIEEFEKNMEEIRDKNGK